MRQAIRKKWTALSEYTSSSASKSATRTPSGSDGSYGSANNSHSSDSDSYYYYSEGSGSYYASYSTARLTTASGTSVSDAASSLSSSSRHNQPGASVPPASRLSDAAPTKSTQSSRDAPSSRGDSLVSSSDALVAKDQGADSAAAVAGRSSDATASNGVTIDDSDALAPQPQQLQLQRRASSVAGSALSSPFSSATFAARRGLDAAAPSSPYHFSEGELAQQPWAASGDYTTTATTPASEEGAVVAVASDVLETIRTVSVVVPPPPAEAQQRRREGGLPYPSHLTFRIIPNAATAGAAAAASEAAGERGAAGAETGRADKAGLGGRVRKAVGDSCLGSVFGLKKAEKQSSVEERAAARQRSYHAQLQSHHVPLVSFGTTRDAGAALADGDNVLPTVAEAAGYRHYEEDMRGTEAEPKKLQKAMRQRRRPGSGLHWKTKYAYGRRAGGGPRGVGESAFAREGDPQRFWIAQLHERSQVHLEAIETG